MAKQYRQAPAMAIDPNKRYVATFHTERGDFQVELFAKEAPMTVNNFVFLAREGFYDGVPSIASSRASWSQGGDPTGTGTRRPRLPVQRRAERADASSTKAPAR